MPDKLKPTCPLCNFELEEAVLDGFMFCGGCESMYNQVVLDTLPRQELSELEQQWLALAPEFDTDKYEYEYCSHRFLEDGEEGWDYNAMVWSVSKDHSFKIIRRPRPRTPNPRQTTPARSNPRTKLFGEHKPC